MKAFTIRFTLLIPMLLFLSLMMACEGTNGQSDDDNIQITLTVSPSDAAMSYLSVQLADNEGQPITDATVTLEGNMNHAGMVPVLVDPVRDDSDGVMDGRYRVPFVFTMLGDWIITVSVERADGAQVEQHIEATVGEQGVIFP